MKLKTNKLLLTSVMIVCLTFLAAALWEVFGLGIKHAPILAFLVTISFGINIAGLILAFSEKKEDPEKYKIGLYGHLILIIGYLTVTVGALATMDS